MVSNFFKMVNLGTSLIVQLLGLGAFTAMALGSVPSQGTKLFHVMWPKRKKEKKIILSKLTFFFLKCLYYKFYSLINYLIIYKKMYL